VSAIVFAQYPYPLANSYGSNDASMNVNESKTQEHAASVKRKTPNSIEQKLPNHDGQSKA
jgi:hypothetical protein